MYTTSQAHASSVRVRLWPCRCHCRAPVVAGAQVRPAVNTGDQHRFRGVHTEARDGFGGSNASFYEKTRPGYPAEALRAIEAEVRQNQDGDFGGANSGDKVLIDLGCGTGKFTREILPFAESEGISLVGVEPVKAMRNQFQAALPGVQVLEGTGESIPAQESCAVALVAAQSFHWMSSAATLREVHRVLVPGGLFALVWNTRDYSRDWVCALEEIIDPFYGDHVPRQQGGRWRQSFRDLEEEGRVGSSQLKKKEQQQRQGAHRPLSFFGGLTEQHFKHSQMLTLEELDGRMRSISVIATRPESERADASRRALDLVKKHRDTRDRLRQTGKVELFYDTEVYWCRKARDSG